MLTLLLSYGRVESYPGYYRRMKGQEVSPVISVWMGSGLSLLLSHGREGGQLCYYRMEGQEVSPVITVWKGRRLALLLPYGRVGGQLSFEHQPLEIGTQRAQRTTKNVLLTLRRNCLEENKCLLINILVLSDTLTITSQNTFAHYFFQNIQSSLCKFFTCSLSFPCAFTKHACQF